MMSSTEPVAVEDEDSMPTECASCTGLLEVPFLRCAICSPTTFLCPACFTMGVEFGEHENDHPYSIVKYDFTLFDDKWTAAEEIKLLSAIMENGLGNWVSISNRMRTKSPAQCENHYVKCYVDQPEAPLPSLLDDKVIDNGAPFIFKLSDDPPRPAEGSNLWHDMGGYSASRGDFNIEFDNFVEMDICHMNSSNNRIDDVNTDIVERSDQDNRFTEEERMKDKELDTEMNLTVLEIYRNALKQRQWRKSIVRDYGLINIRKWLNRFKAKYKNGIYLDFFRPFMRLFQPMLFDKHLESLMMEKKLKSEISKLQEYRKNGITRLRNVHLFTMLRQRRENTRYKRHLLQDVLNHIKDETSAQSWLARQAVLDSSSVPNPLGFPLRRKPQSRLEINGLPGYDKLTPIERDFCSENRFVPEAFMDFAKILKNECSKHGHLRLAQARTLIKIDVNKTRKLFDFLILHGHINKDPL